MSSSPHSTITSSAFDMKNAFSTMNIYNYTSASSGSNYFNSSEDSRDDMIPPTSSLFYNNPYLKDVQAFYAKESPIPPPDPITPPVILTPSPVLPPSLLAPMGNGDDVFLGDAPIIVLGEYVSQDPTEKMMNSVRMPRLLYSEGGGTPRVQFLSKQNATVGAYVQPKALAVLCFVDVSLPAGDGGTAECERVMGARVG
ncbi:hypothetical protein Tco_1041916 [Tanacetum coccineum]|uniref:Uncharacterized protein n=1 Tax=Tanacetum coccineum TaxID=301880 RepID=A0ABQ5GJ15_9ASTR